jgi:hypothetical protein
MLGSFLLGSPPLGVIGANGEPAQDWTTALKFIGGFIDWQSLGKMPNRGSLGHNTSRGFAVTNSMVHQQWGYNWEMEFNHLFFVYGGF